MLMPEKAKPATIASGPALKVERLGSALNHDNIDALREIQARSLRGRFTVGYYLAASLAPLVWGLPR